MVIDETEVATIATAAFEVQHGFRRLKRVDDVRRRRPRVLDRPFEVRVDVRRCIRNRAGTFAAEAIDEVREGAEV